MIGILTFCEDHVEENVEKSIKIPENYHSSTGDDLM